MANQNKGIEVPGYLRFSKLIVWFLYFYVLIGIITLVFRVFLLLASADSTAGFYQWVIKVSSDYLEPFRGIFPTKPVNETGYLDVSSLFAIIVYLFVLWGVHSLINYIQNKIDITTAAQEKELADIKRHKEIASLRPTSTTTRTTTKVKPKTI